MSKPNGIADNPVEASSDLFEIKNYTDALSEFIISCETPMTIAIQGDWGSGKTSFMKMVEGVLSDKVLPIWFNTWQFSQFSMGDRLTIGSHIVVEALF